MSSVLKRNLYNLSRDSSSAASYDPSSWGLKSYRRLSPDPLAPVQYSCMFWVDHLSQSPKTAEDERELADDGTLLEFLKGKFLHWVESLWLMEEFPSEPQQGCGQSKAHVAESSLMEYGVLLLGKLTRMVRARSDVSPRLAGFLKDAEKFIRIHGQNFWTIFSEIVISDGSTPLEFDPTTSEKGDSFRENRVWFMRQTVLGLNKWGATSTLDGHSDWMCDMALSPDLATLAVALADYTIWLGDVKHYKTLESHSGLVGMVVYSAEGKTLASVSDDATMVQFGFGT
ncbi:hypothetical protein B0T25DRAFT_521696 [Lasiosphaeria hispida]|uniref:Uncharacterized protein n=1 Tax=Lasiosphaeria hispida TaxID=260671 RepID=A0AAJ0H896_9PEZI|nr:hypothetical protein B0T25DRAFT_521696 [Lasiosphaeria hispida]